MFWGSVVEAASRLSRLPIWSSPLTSLSSHFLLPPDSCLSRFPSCPKTFVIPHIRARSSHLLGGLRAKFSPSFLLLYLPLTSSRCLCDRINSLRKCRSSTMAPKRTAPRRRLRRSQTPGRHRTPILMPAKQKRTKTKPRPFWIASRPWR